MASRRAGACAWPSAARTRRCFVKPYGTVGQVEPCSATSATTPRAAVLHGADAVVNCVGTFDAKGARTGSTRCRRRGQADRPAGRRGGRGADGADLGHRGRRRVRQRLCPHQGRRRGGGAGAFPRGRDPAPLGVFGPRTSSSTASRGMAKFGPVLPLVGRRGRGSSRSMSTMWRRPRQGRLGRGRAGHLRAWAGRTSNTFRELMQSRCWASSGGGA